MGALEAGLAGSGISLGAFETNPVMLEFRYQQHKFSYSISKTKIMVIAMTTILLTFWCILSKFIGLSVGFCSWMTRQTISPLPRQLQLQYQLCARQKARTVPRLLEQSCKHCRSSEILDPPFLSDI